MIRRCDLKKCKLVLQDPRSGEEVHLSIDEFVKLLTYGEYHHFKDGAHHIRREIRVREEDPDR